MNTEEFKCGVKSKQTAKARSVAFVLFKFQNVLSCKGYIIVPALSCKQYSTVSALSYKDIT